ncbi:MAG: type II toxin-antitoxin system RelE/ParE family toxin, partial [Cyclobacteriaceae bacterium]
SHVIFYRIQRKQLEIIRVLHVRQDVNRHLWTLGGVLAWTWSGSLPPPSHQKDQTFSKATSET